ncbi:hypothetical protein FDECE_14284 [Fusarium decemcellulare]|nr:hypothetical protein FDECE_14284 [Fusarium decemcellulare]
METGDFDQLCNQLLECQCACWAWQSAYTAEVDRNMQLYTEIERLHALVEAQQTRISYVTKENQRLNCLMGHLMPRDVGPTTTYQSVAEEETGGRVEKNGIESTHELERSEVVQKLETIAELSSNSSPSRPPNTPKSDVA